MKKVIFILAFILIIESIFIAANIHLPENKHDTISHSHRVRISKSDTAIAKKILPVAYERMIIDRNFHEDIATYYYNILVEIGYFPGPLK